MNQANTAAEGERAPRDLPVEPGSPALILAATHLFAIEVAGVDATGWEKGDDGLEHRSLHLDLRLGEVLKGSLDRKAAFSAKLPQKREDALTVSDYHGFWSHREVSEGERYLVASIGKSEDPSELLEEPAIQELYDAALSADVQLAVEAEQRFGERLRNSDPDAARELLTFATGHQTAIGQLFAQYLWVRLSPAYRTSQPTLEPLVLDVIESGEASIPLREALIYGVYDAVVAPGPVTEPGRRLLAVLLELLLEPQASALLDRMLQVPVYNLIFRPDQTPPPAAEVVPEADRARMASVARGYRSARAQAVAEWLEK